MSFCHALRIGFNFNFNALLPRYAFKYNYYIQIWHRIADLIKCAKPNRRLLFCC